MVLVLKRTIEEKKHREATFIYDLQVELSIDEEEFCSKGKEDLLWKTYECIVIE